MTTLIYRVLSTIIAPKWRGSLIAGSMTLLGLIFVASLAQNADELPVIEPGQYEPHLPPISNQPAGVDVGIDQTIALSAPVTVAVRVADGSDDAEERVNGSVNLTSSDLELVFDSGGDQIVGMRFTGLDIPPGVTITQAYLQFQVDQTSEVSTTLTIQGEAVDDAAPFVSSKGNISSRVRTTGGVRWTPPSWTTRGEAGEAQRTPDIGGVIQEIVDRPGRVAGNAMVIIMGGSGERTAEAYNGDPSAAPLLYVEFGAPSGDLPPQVTIGTPASNANFSENNVITFTGTALDPEDGDLTAGLSWESNLDGPIGVGGFFSKIDLTAGAHTITATATDSREQTAFDTITVNVFTNTAVLVGAGDIAGCRSEKDLETAMLLDNIAGTVFTLGDNAYPDGTELQFSDCYDSTWGRHRARTRPAPGNHDYHTPGALAYFNYFGAAAGQADQGYYSYDAGAWHIIVLNSECEAVGGCDRDSAQAQWLKADLAANPTECTLAYWHHSRFSSSSSHGSNPRYQDFWQLLYDARADVVLSGHDHIYERFAPQDPSGNADPERGIRQFVVGTGGRNLYPFGPPEPNSEVRENETHGVLKLTLYPGSYDWEFIPIAGQIFTDTGSAACVLSPPANEAPTASDDRASTVKDTPVTIDVAANDSDPDDNLDPTTASIVCSGCTQPSNGTLLNNQNGTFNYTPHSNFNGLDSFVYEICDTDHLCDTAVVNLTVALSAPVTVAVRVADGSDDAEERVNGSVNLTSSDLELVFDSGGDQIVGMRFTGLDIPPGVTITQAYLQFQVDQTSEVSTSLTIQGEAVDDAAPFVSSKGNISSRVRTTAGVRWTPPSWTTPGEAGLAQRTPDLGSVIQEIVDRPGWVAGNAMVMIIGGSGERTAEAYNGDPSAAPLLHIEYISGD